jgi:epoxyqueuosine reductase
MIREYPEMLKNIKKFGLLEDNGLIFKYKIVSVENFPTLQKDIDLLRETKKLSTNEIFRKYIAKRKYLVPDDYPEAKNLIIMAVFTPPARIDVHYKKKIHNLIIPPQYYDDKVTLTELENLIHRNVLQDPQYSLKYASNVHFKHLAVRSGLGVYGKNNICYVQGMGSYIALYGFYTNKTFPKQSLYPLSLMDCCNSCKICENSCPTGIIGKDNFVIDVSKCITLYNEIKGDFPSWADSNVHNALMGCWKCQGKCIGNLEVRDIIIHLDDLLEEETKLLLSKKINSSSEQIICDKLMMCTPDNIESRMPIISRNLRVLLI